MVITKYLTNILLTIIVLVFIGETYVWHISEFETKFSYVTFYMQKGTTQEEMLSDISHAADKEDVMVFVVDRKIESALLEKVRIYGTTGVKEYLKDDTDVCDGNFDSVFLGKSIVRIHHFKEIPDVTIENTYRVIGEKENVVRFKQDLVDKYAGAFPREGYQSFNSRLDIILVWGIVLVFFLLLTLFQVALIKKEMIIRLISGERLGEFVVKKILADIFFYLVIFSISILILKHFTEVTYQLGTSVVCILAFLIINSILYIWLFITDYKKDMTTKRSAKKVLGISYTYKVVTVFITILLMSSCMGLIYEGIQYYKQNDFFENHRNYSYVMIATLNDKREEQAYQLCQDIYKKYALQGKTISLTGLQDLDSKDDNYIFADRGTVGYLKSKIPELNHMDLEEKVYIIRPNDYEKTGNKKENSNRIFTTYYNSPTQANSATGNSKLQFQEIRYSGNIEIISLNGEDGVDSAIKKNPVILLNNLNPESIDQYVWQATMLDISKTEWKALLKDNDFEHEIAYRTNVYDNYIYHLKMIKRGILIGIVLLSILLLLESLIIRTILKYEYQINAIELSIKKVMGYGIFSRHKRIIGITVSCGTVGLLLAVAACFFLGLSAYSYILSGGALILITELAVVIRYIYHLESVNVQRILKGGTI